MLEDHLLAVFSIQDESEFIKAFNPSREFLSIVQKDGHPQFFLSSMIEKIILNI